MTVGEMLGRMSGRELAEWQAFARVESEEQRDREMEARAERGLR